MYPNPGTRPLGAPTADGPPTRDRQNASPTVTAPRRTGRAMGGPRDEPAGPEEAPVSPSGHCERHRGADAGASRRRRSPSRGAGRGSGAESRPVCTSLQRAGPRRGATPAQHALGALAPDAAPLPLDTPWPHSARSPSPRRPSPSTCPGPTPLALTASSLPLDMPGHHSARSPPTRRHIRSTRPGPARRAGPRRGATPARHALAPDAWPSPRRSAGTRLVAVPRTRPAR